MAVHFTDDNFEAEVIKSDIPVLVDFFAEWCGPCKMMAPVIEQLAEEYSGKVKIGKLDTDANPAKSGEFQIQSIPTLVFFKNGEVVNTLMGFKSAEDLKGILDELLK